MFAEYTEIWDINIVSFICFCLCEADYIIFANNINKLRISELRRKTTNINGNNPCMRSVLRCKSASRWFRFRFLHFLSVALVGILNGVWSQNGFKVGWRCALRVGVVHMLSFDYYSVSFYVCVAFLTPKSTFL